MGLGYGLTECTVASIHWGADLEARPASVGRPLPTVDLEIRDAGGRPVPPAIGPGRWLRTGDVGRVDAEGYLTIESRRRDLVLRGGENVYPVEVEHCLETHPAVREAAVVGVDHAELGQEVKAFVVVDPAALRGGEAPLAETLRAWTAERLAYFKVPAHWELRTEPLPRNATGKILKRVLTDGAVNPFRED
jgi:acyl-CoA synthetase (AMP-forming)/AMP-acid ligase II